MGLEESKGIMGRRSFKITGSSNGPLETNTPLLIIWALEDSGEQQFTTIVNGSGGLEEDNGGARSGEIFSPDAKEETWKLSPVQD